MASEPRTASVPSKRGAVLIGALVVLGSLCAADLPAHAALPGLLTIRAALEHYRFDDADKGTLGVLAQLSNSLRGEELAADARLEARFLRAAAGTDLLVLARSRGDAELERSLAQALATQDPLPAALDAELASCASGVYLASVTQMRATLAVLAADAAPTAALLSAASGSQRDLLLVRAVATAMQAPSDVAVFAALGPLGQDPCNASTCPAPYDHVAGSARPALAALAGAGAALVRLREAAQAGDPLAAAVSDDLTPLAATLRGRSLLPQPQLPEASGWTRPDGSALSTTPELLVLVRERGVRYAFAPRARLSESFELETFSRQEPTWPHQAELPFARELRPYIEPLPELVSFIQHAQSGEPMVAAIGVEPGATAHVLAHVLASWKRAGTSAPLLLSAAGGRGGVAQLVALWSEAEGGPDAPLGMRVRLGGYSLKQGEAPTLDIPRVHTEIGWRFDLATLDGRLQGQHYTNSRVSYMADVAAEDLITAVQRVAPACDSVSLTLP